jgi:hypothetical protein
MANKFYSENGLSHLQQERETNKQSENGLSHLQQERETNKQIGRVYNIITFLGLIWIN